MPKRNNCCIAAVLLATACAAAIYIATDGVGGSLFAPVPVSGPASAGSVARTDSGGVVDVRVVSVHDGDTFTCDIDGWPDIAGRHIGVRIAGIDTPEVTDKRPSVRALAGKARGFTERRLFEGERVELRNMERDKYFRILANVYVDGSSLGEELVGEGLAKPYDGSTKPRW